MTDNNTATGFVLVSNRDGKSYHLIGDDGYAACGCIRPTTYRRQDTGQVIVKGDKEEAIPLQEAKERGFNSCGLCERDTDTSPAGGEIA